MGRRKKEEEHENHERWMISYADFVTLLFAFFTALYAISTVDAAKMTQMAASMRASFSGEIFDAGSNTLSLFDGGNGSTAALLNIDSGTGSDIAARRDQSSSRIILDGEADMGRFRRTLEGLLSEEIDHGRVRIYQERRGIAISLGETGNFDSGSVDIRPEGLALLDTIATGLTTIGNHIRIEGHTDNVPINTFRFPSNWELSTARAGTVLRRMETHYGITSDLLAASGYGEQRPVATNDTAEGRARNRRVDIIILNPTIARAEPL